MQVQLVLVFVGCYHSRLRQPQDYRICESSQNSPSPTSWVVVSAPDLRTSSFRVPMETMDAATRDKEVFETCAPCHGPDGSGNPAVSAPNIAGMSEWYVRRAAGKFSRRARGAHFNDVEGMRMRPMALIVPY